MGISRCHHHDMRNLFKGHDLNFIQQDSTCCYGAAYTSGSLRRKKSGLVLGHHQLTYLKIKLIRIIKYQSYRQNCQEGECSFHGRQMCLQYYHFDYYDYNFLLFSRKLPPSYLKKALFLWSHY